MYDYQKEEKSVSIVTSTVPKFEHYNIVDFKIRYDGDAIIVTVLIADKEIGTVTFTTEKSCVEIIGKADVFGYKAAKIIINLCIDVPNKKVCADGKAYIKILGRDVKIGEFYDCAGLRYELSNVSVDPCLIGLSVALINSRVLAAFNRKVQHGYNFRGYKCMDGVTIPELVKIHLDFDCEPERHCLIDPSLYVTVNLITKKVEHIEGENT